MPLPQLLADESLGVYWTSGKRSETTALQSAHRFAKLYETLRIIAKLYEALLKEPMQYRIVRSRRAHGEFGMLQLAGYYLWESSFDSATIGRQATEKGIAIAKGEMRDRVLEPTYRSLSDGDIAFCRAMLEDEGESRIADIAQRTGKSPSTVNTYRARLIEQGIIGSTRRGYVGFELPLFREYLSER